MLPAGTDCLTAIPQFFRQGDIRLDRFLIGPLPGTARDALDVLAAAPADVLLLDIRMPEMDGIEFAQHLQKLPQPPAITSSAMARRAASSIRARSSMCSMRPTPMFSPAVRW